MFAWQFSRPLGNARINGNMDTPNPTKAVWDQTLSTTIEQACERAILRLFSDVHDEAIRQALAQAFLAGVDWCFSEQSDNDIAEAALSNRTRPLRSRDWVHSANGHASSLNGTTAQQIRRVIVETRHLPGRLTRMRAMSSKSTPRHPMTCLQKPSRRSAKVVMNAARYGERTPPT